MFETAPSGLQVGPRLTRILLLLAALVGLLRLPDAAAQDRDRGAVTLSIDEAIQIALVSNHALRSLRLDVKTADSQVKAGWGELLPQIALQSSYTRNIESANPFSGSSAGGLFQSLGFLDWLAFNEDARTDSDPSTGAISVQEYFLRRQAGLDAAGVVSGGSSDNPFAVPSVYNTGLSLTQKLFDGRAIFGATGAQRWLKPFSELAVDREEQLLVDRVQRAFYGSLLAGERSSVMQQSVDRARATLDEVSRQVSEGVAPKFQRLSAEVELANLETQFVQATNASQAALDDLRLLLGMPSEQALHLRGSLAADAAEPLPEQVQNAVNIALSRRPDLEQSRVSVELERIQLQVARSAYLPELNAVANLGLVGSIPDNRTDIISDPDDPFRFTTRNNRYFADPYWNWNFSVGLSLRWTLFDGFQTHQQIQQRKIALDKARIGGELLERSVSIEVERTLRDVQAARLRMRSQERNVDRADLNYTFARERLREGVASPIEVREASDQLDQSRLNYLQAIHDFLVARSAFETAIGTPVAGGASSSHP